jgi:hypothetical protein
MGFAIKFNGHPTILCGPYPIFSMVSLCNIILSLIKRGSLTCASTAKRPKSV